MQTSFTPAQLLDPDVASSEQILRKCVHCGFCTATCPTYVLLGDELDSPRGRIYLIKDMLEGDRAATAEVVPHLDRCLSCLACMTTCPSGVHYQHLIDHARAHIERTYRRPWRERMLRAFLAHTLPYPRRLRAALAVAIALRSSGSVLPRGMRDWARRLPAPLRALFSLLPPRLGIAAPALTAVPSPARRGRVALLAGCAQGVLSPNAQAACVRLLTRAGYEVVVIEGCCGSLVHHLGRSSHAHAFAVRLMDRLLLERERRGLDAIAVSASGCGTHLKDYGYLFRTDPQLAQKAATVSALARDITEILHEGGLPPRTGRPLALPIAYHSACSMQHGQHLDTLPRKLLQEAGFTLVPFPEGHLCCGSAGTYNILEPQLAQQLRDRKLDHIQKTHARLIATGNVGCMVQLASASRIPVVHTVELLDWATGGPAPAGSGRTEADDSLGVDAA
jgi:glycolate oxidase iron-sulfur subunit